MFQEFFLTAIKSLIFEMVIDRTATWTWLTGCARDRVLFQKKKNLEKVAAQAQAHHPSWGPKKDAEAMIPRVSFNEMLSTRGWSTGILIGFHLQNLAHTNFAAALVQQVLWLKRKFWRLHCISSPPLPTGLKCSLFSNTPCMSEVVRIHSKTICGSSLNAGHEARIFADVWKLHCAPRQRPWWEKRRPKRSHSEDPCRSRPWNGKPGKPITLWQPWPILGLSAYPWPFLFGLFRRPPGQTANPERNAGTAAPNEFGMHSVCIRCVACRLAPASCWDHVAPCFAPVFWRCQEWNSTKAENEEFWKAPRFALCSLALNQLSGDFRMKHQSRLWKQNLKILKNAIIIINFSKNAIYRI